MRANNPETTVLGAAQRAGTAIGQLNLLGNLQIALDWVLINTFMATGNWENKEKTGRKHDSYSWGRGKVYVLLLPITRQHYAALYLSCDPCVL